MPRYSTEVASKLADRIATGEPYPSIFKDKAMPTRPTFNSWLREHAELRTLVTGAEKVRATRYIERIEAELAELRDSSDTDLGFIGSKRLAIDEGGRGKATAITRIR